MIRHRILRRFTARYNRVKLQITKRYEAVLCRHSWPGNIRELWKRTELCLHAQRKNGTVDIVDLPDYLLETRTTGPNLPTLAEVEYQHVMKVLKACDGNRVRARRRCWASGARLFTALSLVKDPAILPAWKPRADPISRRARL